MTASRVHILIAALMGAAGVALWSVAAHRGGAANLVTAAQFLLLHAPVLLGLTACRKLDLAGARLLQLASAGIALGASLFAGDLAARAFLGGGLFPYAAPAGGLLTIVGWLMAALAALVPGGNGLRRHGS